MSDKVKTNTKNSLECIGFQEANKEWSVLFFRYEWKGSLLVFYQCIHLKDILNVNILSVKNVLFNCGFIVAVTYNLNQNFE